MGSEAQSGNVEELNQKRRQVGKEKGDTESNKSEVGVNNKRRNEKHKN